LATVLSTGAGANVITSPATARAIRTKVADRLFSPQSKAIATAARSPASWSPPTGTA
jgi:hypothetical protein